MYILHLHPGLTRTLYLNLSTDFYNLHGLPIGHTQGFSTLPCSSMSGDLLLPFLFSIFFVQLFSYTSQISIQSHFVNLCNSQDPTRTPTHTQTLKHLDRIPSSTPPRLPIPLITFPDKKPFSHLPKISKAPKPPTHLWHFQKANPLSRTPDFSTLKSTTSRPNNSPSYLLLSNISTSRLATI